MIDFNFEINDARMLKAFTALSGEKKKQALRDSGQVIIASTKIGFMKRVAPDGVEWDPNYEKYSEAKGGAAPLSGPTKKKIIGGPWAGKYEFAKVNSRRMANSLTLKVNKTRALVDYTTGAEKRAQFTQEGGEGRILLKNLRTGRQKVVKVDVPARVHLGIADEYSRMGNKTDVELITEIFNDMIDSNF